MSCRWSLAWSTGISTRETSGNSRSCRRSRVPSWRTIRRQFDPSLELLVTYASDWPWMDGSWFDAWQGPSIVFFIRRTCLPIELYGSRCVPWKLLVCPNYSLIVPSINSSSVSFYRQAEGHFQAMSPINSYPRGDYFHAPEAIPF